MSLIKALVIAAALSVTPSCAAMRLDNPVAAAKTIDQQAYALISVYADLLEEAAKFVANPAVPLKAKQALIKAEAVATPAVQTLEIAVVAYLKAQADMRTGAPNAAATFAIAAGRLSQAFAAAQAPVHALQTALKP